MHDKRVDESSRLMTEDLRKRSDNLKPMFFPHGDRACVGADNHVELNGRKAKPPGLLHGVLTHQRAETFSTSLRRNHITGVRDVRASPWIVSPQDVGAENMFHVRDNERMMVGNNIRRGASLLPPFE